jgi:hypothetical protein
VKVLLNGSLGCHSACPGVEFLYHSMLNSQGVENKLHHVPLPCIQWYPFMAPYTGWYHTRVDDTKLNSHRSDRYTRATNARQFKAGVSRSISKR